MSLSQKLLTNWKSGVTVALVSLPLSISLAVAANATPTMGVITAFWAGIIAAIFGGSNYNVVGPTGALSGLLAAYVLRYGLETVQLITVLAGAAIILAYIFRLDRYIAFVPSSVVHGFTLGVAFIIALNQLNFAMGLQGLPTHELFIVNVWESLKNIGSADLPTFGLFSASLALLFLLIKYAPKIPGPIILAPIGITLGYFSAQGDLSIPLLTLASRFGDIKASLVAIPELSWSLINAPMIKTVLAVALVAILETLISARIADAMTKTKHDQRKEVLGLGLANLASGLAGGIPATAALARTALNIKSGADHKTSSGINAASLALIALVFLHTFQYLPLAVVAAILVYTAFRMIAGEHFVHLYRHDKTAFYISMLVALITVVEDPILGILIGATASLLFFVHKLSQAQSEITLNKNKEMIGRLYGPTYSREELGRADVLVYRFAGQMTYVNAQSHLTALRQVNGATKTVILNFRGLFYIDVDGLDALTEIIEELQGRELSVALTSIGDYLLPLISKTKWYQEKLAAGKVFSRTTEALASLGFEVAASKK